LKVSFITDSWLDRDGYGSLLSSFVDFFKEDEWEVTVYHQENEHIQNSCGKVVATNLSALLDRAMKGPNDPLSPLNFLFESQIVFVAYLTYYPLMEISRFVTFGSLVFLYPGITPFHLHIEDDPLKEFTKEAVLHLGLLKFADRIIVNSQYMLSELSELAAIDSDFIKVIPLSVAPGLLNAIELPRQNIELSRQNVEVPCQNETNSFTLLYVGRISGNKRVDLLIKGLALIKQKVAGITLIIAGMHSRVFTSSYMESLRSQIEKAGLTENVVFKGDLTSAELAELYSSADVFVTASLHEGFCLPVAEAKFFAVPAVVPDISATPQTAGIGGVSYEPENMEAFAEIIVELFSDRNKLSELSKAAQSEASQYTQEQFFSNLKVFIDEVSAFSKEDNSRSISVYGRGNSRVNICDAVANHSVSYLDTFSLPLIGSFIRWLRRKITFPVEKTVMRPVIKQQSLWNKLLVSRLKDLQKDIKELKELNDCDLDSHGSDNCKKRSDNCKKQDKHDLI